MALYQKKFANSCWRVWSFLPVWPHLLVYLFLYPLQSRWPGTLLSENLCICYFLCGEHSFLNTWVAPLLYFLHTFPKVFPSRHGFSWALYLKLPFHPLFIYSYPLLLLFSLDLLPSDFLCVLLIFCIFPVDYNLSERWGRSPIPKASV